MCDPVTLLLGALGAAGGLVGAMQEPPKPPPVAQPATPAPDTRNPGATVRIGQEDDNKNTQVNAPNAQRGQTLTRSSGKSLGLVPLGRGGLSI